MGLQIFDDGQPTSGDYASAHAQQIEAKLTRLCGKLGIDPAELEPPPPEITPLGELFRSTRKEVSDALRNATTLRDEV